MEPVNGLRDNRNCGVETERLIRPFHIVVNGLGHSDDVDALSGQIARHPKRILAAHGDHVINLEPLQVGEDLFHVALALRRVRPRSPQDGAATRQNSGDRQK